MKEALKRYSNDEKEEIINNCMPFIKYTASRLSWRLPPCLTEDDLISAGIIGLLDALERYDPNISKLNTFVEHRIKGSMLDLIEKNQLLPKQMNKKIYDLKRVVSKLEIKLGRTPEDTEIAKELNISLDEYYETMNEINKAKWVSLETIDKNGEDVTILDFISYDSIEDPQNKYEQEQLLEVITKSIEELSENEKMVLALYYYEELTMKEIARVLSITEGRVSQIHNQAVFKLKSKIVNYE